MLRHLFFILFFIACNLFNSSNSFLSNTLIDDSYEELNPIVNSSYFFDEELADETEKDDYSKYLMLIASDYTINKSKNKKKPTTINSLVKIKTTLLNFYIDLPPPGIS